MEKPRLIPADYLRNNPFAETHKYKIYHDGYREPNCEDIQKHYLIPLSRGIKGFLIWQYRPEALGDEAPCWGNIDYLGNNRKWQTDCIALSNLFLKHKDIILNQQAKKPKVAIFCEPKSELFTYSMTNATDLYDDALIGLYNYLYECNKEIQFIREEDITKGNLNFEAIYFVSTFCFKSSLTEKLKKYVENGGMVIFEPLAAMHDEDTGYHAPVIPGCGIDTFAGVRQTSCYHKDKLDDVDFSDAQQKTFIVNSGAQNYIGKNFRAYYQPISDSAQPTATFENGAPAIWENTYGKGKVVMVGSSLSACYPAKENYAFYNSIGSVEGWRETLPCGVRGDIVRKGNEGLLVIDNRSESDYTLQEMSDFELYKLYDIIDGNLVEKQTKVQEGNIPANSVRLFYVKFKK